LSGINITHCYTNCTREVSSALAFACMAQTFRVGQGSNIRPIGIRQKEAIAGLSLLKIHTIWEAFLQDVFLRFMCGAPNATGVAPILLRSKEKNLSAALRTLLGSRDYVSWNPSQTVRRASAYFRFGEPFSTAIASIRSSLDDSYSIRNNLAHRSQYSTDRFRQVVRTHLGYVPRGMTPGRFLLTQPTGPTTSNSFLATYAALFSAAANQIVS
jgi:hypothetical protein